MTLPLMHEKRRAVSAALPEACQINGLTGKDSACSTSDLHNHLGSPLYTSESSARILHASLAQGEEVGNVEAACALEAMQPLSLAFPLAAEKSHSTPFIPDRKRSFCTELPPSCGRRPQPGLSRCKYRHSPGCKCADAIQHIVLQKH